MRSILKTTCLLLLISLLGCKRSAQDLLTWRWSFTGIYLNNQHAFIDSIGSRADEESAIHNFLLDYKLVLRKDSTFDIVIFKNYMHGKWQYVDHDRTLMLTDDAAPAQKIRMVVDSISPVLLAVHMNDDAVSRLIPPFAQSDNGFSFFKHNGPYVFVLTADKEKFGNEKTDPYSQQTNFWRVKPKSPESDQQIVERVKNHIGFIKLLMQNVADGKSTYIFLHSFRTPLIIGSGYLSIHSYDNSSDAWNECFYDSTQAKRGYDMLEKAVSSGVKVNDTGDRFTTNVDMLQQLMDHLGGK